MDTPQSKAFWLGHNLNILYFRQASGGDMKDKVALTLKRSVEGFAQSLGISVELPDSSQPQYPITQLRDTCQMDLAIVRTEFVAKSYLFGFDFSSWAAARGGYGEGSALGADVDLTKVETNLRNEARALGLLAELEECIAAAKNPALSRQQFNELVSVNVLLRMTAKLDATPSDRSIGKPASNHLFVVMPMIAGDPGLIDVLDTIQETAKACGLDATRVDEIASSGRITDNIVDGLKTAAFVVVDLTHSRPNVYWEAGYTHGLGKLPIYIARTGTDPAFDIKDYPLIYFANNRELREKLGKRLRGMQEMAAGM
jgi:hypothetical protein